MTDPNIRYPADVSVEWRYRDTQLVVVEIAAGGEPLARLAPGALPGWSRFAAIDGPCALGLT